MGRVIANHRKEQKMTQEEVGKVLGVSIAAVSKWENGLAYPDMTLIPSIARLFHIRIDDLFQYDKYEKEQKRMAQIKAHFEEEAQIFDGVIKQLIPYYHQMIQALVDILPFENHEAIEVIDLGCGTGMLARKIKERYPHSHITCLDLSSNMIEMAKIKMENYEGISYEVDDFYSYRFKKSYDVVVSSLALHHLVTDEDKKDFFKKIYEALNQGGYFYNLDVVLGSSHSLQAVYEEKWKAFMAQSCSQEEIEGKWLPKYCEEDSPAQLMGQLKWLEEIGFKEIDVIVKYFNYSVYGGSK